MGKVLHASKSGYFPRCLVDTPALPRDSNYIIGGIQEAMTPFWRVRKWEISVSGSLVNPGEEFIFSGTPNELFGFPEAVEKEEDLVCFNSENKFYTAFYSELVPWATLDGEPFETPGTLFVGLGYPLAPYGTFEANSIVKNGDIYKFPFFWGIQGIVLLSDPLDQGWVPVGTYTFDVLGVSTAPRTLYGPDGYSASVTAVVSAKEYWSYGGTYNTSTGEPL
jgi:hypothetical protein